MIVICRQKLRLYICFTPHNGEFSLHTYSYYMPRWYSLSLACRTTCASRWTTLCNASDHWDRGCVFLDACFNRRASEHYCASDMVYYCASYSFDASDEYCARLQRLFSFYCRALRHMCQVEAFSWNALGLCCSTIHYTCDFAIIVCIILQLHTVLTSL